MQVIWKTDRLTKRPEIIQLQPDTFQEEQFIQKILDVLVDGESPGSIEVTNTFGTVVYQNEATIDE